MGWQKVLEELLNLKNSPEVRARVWGESGESPSRVRGTVDIRAV